MTNNTPFHTTSRTSLDIERLLQRQVIYTIFAAMPKTLRSIELLVADSSDITLIVTVVNRVRPSELITMTPPFLLPSTFLSSTEKLKAKYPSPCPCPFRHSPRSFVFAIRQRHEDYLDFRSSTSTTAFLYLSLPSTTPSRHPPSSQAPLFSPPSTGKANT